LPHDYLDSQQLRQQGLIHLLSLGTDQWCGKPTHRGIALVLTDFGAGQLKDAVALWREHLRISDSDKDGSESPVPRTKVTEYVNQCPLMGLAAKHELTWRHSERLKRLREVIETVAARISKQFDELEIALRLPLGSRVRRRCCRAKLQTWHFKCRN
jgi:hypothetical protein